MGNHTDLEYKDASQIAYLDFLENARDYLGPDNEPYTIKELVEGYLDMKGANNDKWEDYYGLGDCKSDDEKFRKMIQYSNLSFGEKQTLLDISDDAYHWKYLTGMDHNSETGFSGYLLDTGDGDAMVAFRGSESMKFPDGEINAANSGDDWGNADFALIEGETVQDLEAKRFSWYVKAYLKEHPEYDSIDVTGHSLGGHLAEEFTIFCAEDDPELYDRIGRCVNLDGPGRKLNYTISHKDGIKKAKDKLYVYRTSPVGEMLYECCPIDHITYVKIKDSSEVAEIGYNQDDLLYKAGYYTFGRHSLCAWEVDENGNFVEGDPSVFAVGLGVISKELDVLGIGAVVLGALRWITKPIVYENQYGEVKLTEFGKLFVAGTATALIGLALVFTLAHPVVLAVVALVALFAGGVYLWENYGEKAVLAVTNSFKKHLNDFKEDISKFERNIKKFFKNLKEEAKKVGKSGYAKTDKHPHITVDTNLLREYANRLNMVAKKLQTIDTMIAHLYGEVGLFDMIDLTVTDIQIGTDFPINRCIHYLNTTANNFETAEKNIKQIFQ